MPWGRKKEPFKRRSRMGLCCRRERKDVSISSDRSIQQYKDILTSKPTGGHWQNNTKTPGSIVPPVGTEWDPENESDKLDVNVTESNDDFQNQKLSGRFGHRVSGKFGTRGWGETSRYDGKYDSNGKRSGQGEETWQNGITYRGSWKNDLKNGLGEWRHGKMRYEGQWQDNLKNGWGIYESPDIRYEGYWENDLLCGGGKCLYRGHEGASQQFQGNWNKGVREGKGTLMYANKCTYDGEWSEDMPNGRGVFTWDSGVRLECSWANGIPEAGGVFSSSGGQFVADIPYGEVLTPYAKAKMTAVDTCHWSDDLLNFFEEYLQQIRVDDEDSDDEITDFPYSRKQSEKFQFGEVPQSWSVISELGHGACGSVYKCLNNTDGSFFAMKRVDIRIGSSQRVRESSLLHKELKVLRDLRHENIVGYLGAKESMEGKGELSVMMELVSGGDIASVLGEMGCGFKLPVIKIYSRDVVRGCEYLHSKSIAHRDIKGGNVLVSRTGVAKLADFGLSTRLDQISGAKSFGSIRGTPYFISPEMVRGESTSAELLQKSDVWSIGATVFQMCTSEPPWKEFGVAPFYYHVGRIERGDTNAIPLPTDVDPELAAFILAAMGADPDTRPTATLLLSHNFLHNVHRPRPSRLGIGGASSNGGRTFSSESVGARSRVFRNNVDSAHETDTSSSIDGGSNFMDRSTHQFNSALNAHTAASRPTTRSRSTPNPQPKAFFAKMLPSHSPPTPPFATPPSMPQFTTAPSTATDLPTRLSATIPLPTTPSTTIPLPSTAVPTPHPTPPSSETPTSNPTTPMSLQSFIIHSPDITPTNSTASTATINNINMANPSHNHLVAKTVNNTNNTTINTNNTNTNTNNNSSNGNNIGNDTDTIGNRVVPPTTRPTPSSRSSSHLTPLRSPTLRSKSQKTPPTQHTLDSNHSLTTTTML